MKYLVWVVALGVVLPLVELYLLVQLGRATKPIVPVVLVVGTGLAGMALIRARGRQMWRRMRGRSGGLTLQEVRDGGFLVIAGVLLLIPGIITDFFAILLLTPFGQRLAEVGFLVLFRRWLERRAAQFTPREPPESTPERPVIDVEFTRKEALP